MTWAREQPQFVPGPHFHDDIWIAPSWKFEASVSQILTPWTLKLINLTFRFSFQGTSSQVPCCGFAPGPHCGTSISQTRCCQAMPPPKLSRLEPPLRTASLLVLHYTVWWESNVHEWLAQGHIRQRRLDFASSRSPVQRSATKLHQYMTLKGFVAFRFRRHGVAIVLECTFSVSTPADSISKNYGGETVLSGLLYVAY